VGWYVSLGGTLAALSIIYLTLKYAGELGNTTSSWAKLLEMFLWPLTIFVFLGNGRLLAQIVKIFRAIGYTSVSKILEIQLAGVTFRWQSSKFA